jgi:hypothetical protein
METNTNIEKINKEEKNTQETKINKEEGKNIAKNLAEIARSKTFRVVLYSLLALVLLAGVFNIGVAVGYRKANFSYSWGENYHTNFGGPRSGFMEKLPPPLQMKDDFINANGTTGPIIKIDGNSLIIKGKDSVEKTIVATEKTTIVSGRQNLKVSDLKVGDLTVTIGQPNSNGQIEATLIRVFNSNNPQ